MLRSAILPAEPLSDGHRAPLHFLWLRHASPNGMTCLELLLKLKVCEVRRRREETYDRRFALNIPKCPRSMAFC